MLRILTYNVHSCIGSDRKSNPARIAEVIADCRPDIIALQELDVRRARTGGIDQAHAIATHLSMAVHFHPALHVEEEKYGDAILTALPSRLVKAGPLPSLGEPRGAIWVAVDVGGVELQVINTHLGLSRRERLNQVATLLGPVWLGNPSCRSPRILVGDFNAVPRSAAYRMVAGRMKDAQATITARRPGATFPARLPLLRIDHIFLDSSMEVADVRVHRSRLTRTASDHLPLTADIGNPWLGNPKPCRSVISTAQRHSRREELDHHISLPRWSMANLMPGMMKDKARPWASGQRAGKNERESFEKRRATPGARTCIRALE